AKQKKIIKKKNKKSNPCPAFFSSADPKIAEIYSSTERHQTRRPHCPYFFSSSSRKSLEFAAATTIYPCLFIRISWDFHGNLVQNEKIFKLKKELNSGSTLLPKSEPYFHFYKYPLLVLKKGRKKGENWKEFT
ncbi:hypothetical protein AABB24_011790, partial [Solanum stoloniferum]